jgi:hypothetical protein
LTLPTSHERGISQKPVKHSRDLRRLLRQLSNMVMGWGMAQALTVAANPSSVTPKRHNLECRKPAPDAEYQVILAQRYAAVALQRHRSSLPLCLTARALSQPCAAWDTYVCLKLKIIGKMKRLLLRISSMPSADLDSHIKHMHDDSRDLGG